MNWHLDRLQILLEPRALTAAAVAVPLFAVLAPKLLYIPLAIGAGAILLRYMTGPPPLRGAWWGLIVWSIVFIGWLFASALWSIEAGASLFQAGAVFGYTAIGLLVLRQCAALDDGARRIGGISIAAGLVVYAAVAGFVLARSGDGRALASATALAAIVAWPCAMWLWTTRRHMLAAMALAVPALLSLSLGHASVFAALAAGGVICVAASLWRRATAWGVAVVLPATVLLAPFAASRVDAGPWLKSVPEAIEFSLYHRVKIWRFTAERIAERPVAGWGLDASRRIPGGDRTVDVNADIGYAWPKYGTRALTLPLHPHNAALQIWLELGAIGAAIVAALLAAIPLLLLRARWSAPEHMAALATITTTFVVAMLSFGLWQSRWFPVMWFAAAVYRGLARHPAERVPGAAAQPVSS